jgi:hypothetical protein
MLDKVRALWRELATPDNQARNWYEWSTNQISHFGLGIFAAYVGTFLTFSAIGEFPPKMMLFAFIGVSYLLFELIFQGWKGWDTIEDWIFFCAYGAGNAILMFTEQSPGSFVADADFWIAGVGLGMAAGHLMVGIAIRLR